MISIIVYFVSLCIKISSPLALMKSMIFLSIIAPLECLTITTVTAWKKVVLHFPRQNKVEINSRLGTLFPAHCWVKKNILIK